MAECELFKQCPFADERRPADGCGIVCRSKYCRGNPDACARHLVFKSLGRSAVPNDLQPHMLDRARRMVRDKSLTCIEPE